MKKLYIIIILTIIGLMAGCTQAPDSNIAVVNVSNEIFTGDTNVKWKNTVIVAKTGGDFDTIQGAIDSITDSAKNNTYQILVNPGNYVENVTLKNYIGLNGQTLGAATISGINGVLLTLPDEFSYVSNMDFVLTPTLDDQVIIDVTQGGDHEFFVVTANATSFTPGVSAKILEGQAGSITWSDSGVVYNMFGNQVGTNDHQVFDMNGDTTVIFLRTSIRFTMNDSDDNLSIYNDASTGQLILSQVDIIGSVTGENYNGTASIVSHLGTGVLKLDILVVLDMTGPGTGTGFVFFVDTISNDALIQSTSSSYAIRGFDANFLVNLGSGDTFQSSFDLISARNGTTGNGTFDLIAHDAFTHVFNITDPTQTPKLILDNSGHFLQLGSDIFNSISLDAFVFHHPSDVQTGNIVFMVENEANESAIMLQVGQNNSASILGGSMMIMPNNMVNNDFARNLSQAINCLDVYANFNVVPRLQCDTLGYGASLLVQGGIHIFRQLFVGEGIFSKGPGIFNMEGTNFTIFNGSLYPNTPVIIEQTIIEGQEVNVLNANFDVVLSPFSNGQTSSDDWLVVTNILCNTNNCAKSDGVGNVQNIIMVANFTTIDVNETTLNFVYSLVGVQNPRPFEVEVNNGSGWVQVFMDDGTDTQVEVSLDISTDFTNISNAGVRFICNNNAITRLCFVDDLLINGTATESTEFNVSGVDSTILLGDGSQSIFWNDSANRLQLPQNTSFLNVSTGTNPGTDICIDVNSRLCACGSCA